MRKIDTTSDLQDGIEPAPGPSPQADGLPGFSSGRPRLPPRPRLCEQGPCRHYHRLGIQADSESPNAQRIPVRLPVLPVGAQAVPDGTLYQAPATFHMAVSHYCYPDVGIEMSLGDTPVIHCNRWDPMDVETVLDRVRKEFIESEPGRRYTHQVEEWEAARAKEAQDANEADALIASSLIDAQLERYRFAVVAHDRSTGRYAISCDAYPSASWYQTEGDADAVDAIEMHKDTIRTRLRELYARGESFPEPPMKESK